MKEPFKITDEEIGEIQTLRNKFQEKVFLFGNLYLEKFKVDESIKEISERELQLNNDWKILQKQESEMIDSILKKYGEGNLDLSKGIFTPSETL